MFRYALFFSLFFFDVYSKVYFKEEFTDGNWEEKWISSEHSDSSTQWGKFILSPGKHYGDREISQGIQTSENEKSYGLTTKFEPFSNKDKVLVVQYTVRHAQDIKCGGGYIKLFDCRLKPKDLHPYTPYLLMFGPDICGPNKRVQIIFVYRERKLKIKRKINCKDDHLTHLYTLIIKPDNTYVVKIDNKVESRGELEDDWDFLLPRKIKDPKAVESKNELRDNSNYDETSSDSLIDNPNYIPDPNLYVYNEICGVGFDLWQVEAGSIFDNILITDDELEAEDHGNQTWGVIIEKEKEIKIRIIKDALAGDVIHTETDSSTKRKPQHDEF